MVHGEGFRKETKIISLNQLPLMHEKNMHALGAEWRNVRTACALGVSCIGLIDGFMEESKWEVTKDI